MEKSFSTGYAIAQIMFAVLSSKWHLAISTCGVDTVIVQRTYIRIKNDGLSYTLNLGVEKE